MPIITSCACGKTLRAKDEFAGKRLKCPACGQVITIPTQAEEPPLADAKDDENDTVEITLKPDQRLPGVLEPFWFNPDDNDNLIALDDKAIYLASVNDQSLDELRQYLAQGRELAELLEDANTTIPLEDIKKIESNLHNDYIDVKWKPATAWSETESTLWCADKEARNQIMEALRGRLGPEWKSAEVHYPRWRAALLPAGVGGCLLILSFAMYMAASGHDEPGDARRPRLGAKRKFMGYIVDLLGPTVTLILGLLLLTACVGWLFVRVRTPPIMWTLTPARK